MSRERLNRATPDTSHNLDFATHKSRLVKIISPHPPCYHLYMTKLLEQAVAQLRELPDDFQDKAAKQLIQYVDEISSDDRISVEEGRNAFNRGEFVSLDQWQHDMGIGNN